MTYEEWEAAVPEEIRSDSLWKMKAYRLALFLADLAWEDSRSLVTDPRTHRLAAQLYEATTSISPNIAEGYSRGTSRDCARFYEYALGSAREARDWVGENVAHDRVSLLTEIIRLLLIMVPQQRQHALREMPRYDTNLH